MKEVAVEVAEGLACSEVTQIYMKSFTQASINIIRVDLKILCLDVNRSLVIGLR